MKKALSLSLHTLARTIMAMPVAAALITSCSTDSPTIETLAILPLASDGFKLYADQETDTTLFLRSSGSWQISTTAPTWLTVSPTSGAVGSDGLLDTRLTLALTPNVSGLTRTAALQASNNSGQTVGMPITQYAHLNIAHPQVRINDTGNTFEVYFDPKTYTAQTDSIILTLYADSVRLTTDADWLAITTPVLHKGNRTTTLSITQNTTASPRTATITLTASNGVTNNISLTQNKEN